MNSKSFKANPGALKEIRNFLSAFLIEKNIEKSLIEKIILAAGEAAMNIVQHSYNGKNDNEIIRTEIYLNNQELEIHFFDFVFRLINMLRQHLTCGKLVFQTDCFQISNCKMGIAGV